MKQTLQIDTTLKGFFKAASYLVICLYNWMENKGIDAYAVSVLLLFMILDMFFGIWKAKRVPSLKNPSSTEAKKGIATKAVMFTIPVVSGLIWGLFDKENVLKVINTLLIALAMAEGYSVLGNAGAVYAKKNLTEYDAVTYIFKTISSIIKSIIDKFLKKLKNEADNIV